ncbi:hypothetical protein KUCAC02_037235, partial [Chaenocephalus aceratus]
DEARRKRSASSPRKKRSHSSKQEVVPVLPLPFYLQPMLVLTPGGLVQVAQAPPPGPQLTQAPPPFVQLTQAPPPGLQLTQAPPPGPQLTQAPPPFLQLTQAPPPFLQLTQAPPFFLQLTQALPLTQAPPPGLQLTQASPPRLQRTQAPPPFLQLTQASSPIIKPLPNHFLPYKGAAVLQFDSSLMFLESQEEVRDWLSGRGGVAAPGGRGLPYLPPSVSSVRALSALLRAGRSLSNSSTRSVPLRPPATPERGGRHLGSTPPLRDTQDAAGKKHIRLRLPLCGRAVPSPQHQTEAPAVRPGRTPHLSIRLRLCGRAVPSPQHQTEAAAVWPG